MFLIYYNIFRSKKIWTQEKQSLSTRTEPTRSKEVCRTFASAPRRAPRQCACQTRSDRHCNLATMRRGIRRIILTKSATLQLIWYPDAVLVPIRRKHENSPCIIIRLQRSTTYLPTRRSNLFITHPCVPPSRTLTYLERKIQATRLFRSQLAIVLSSHR